MKISLAVLKKYAGIVLGCIVFAAGIAFFLDPNSLAPGGVSGVAIIVSDFIDIKTGTMVLILNIPLLVLGFVKLGKGFLFGTVFATLVSSMLINLFLPFGTLTADPLLASVAGGALVGCGMGLVFRNGGTTGGTDIIVKVLKQKYRHLKTGRIFLCADAVVVASSALVFRDVDIALYAAIALTVSSLVIDLVLYGKDGAKLLFIISKTPFKIADRLLTELDIGATYMSGMGAYSNEKKRILMVAVKKTVFYRVRDIIKQEDPDAFMIVSSASEIFGEGFKPHNSEEL